MNLLRTIKTILISIFSVNVWADNLLKFDGVYISEPSYERLDQSWFRYYFRFYPDGKVYKGAWSGEVDIDKLKNSEPQLGQGKYKVMPGNTVQFEIGLHGYKFRSRWVGTFKDTGIEFKIENPDFEDIDGLYRFYNYGNST